MNKKELISKLYEERGIYFYNPSKLKVIRSGPVITEITYNGIIHIDKLPETSAKKEGGTQ